MAYFRAVRVDNKKAAMAPIKKRIPKVGIVRLKISIRGYIGLLCVIVFKKRSRGCQSSYDG
jgi:hypothetical protein